MRTSFSARIFSAATALAVALASAGAAQAGPAVLVDLATGKVLEQEDAFVPWYPASLTKLMTTFVRAAKERPSKMGYKPGSVLTVDNAIKILMVKSANDVATAVAESIAGSHADYAKRMNAEAARLGMSGTRFVNAHGWHAETQMTTARDMAVLAMAMRNEFPEYRHYYSIEALAAEGKIMENSNDLMLRFEGADGMKTGYTCPSGFNLVASATRGGRSLLAVVLGEPTVEARADKAANMLARGFGLPGDAAPYLGQLRPSGAEPASAADLRPVICTEAHWKAVTEARGPTGKPAYTSPYLSKEPLHKPQAVAVALGGATGPKPDVPVYANVPIPTPRPAYTPDAMAESGAQGG
jgi:D-alanyl-D-alanine carboxypeptidase